MNNSLRVLVVIAVIGAPVCACAAPPAAELTVAAPFEAIRQTGPEQGSLRQRVAFGLTSGAPLVLPDGSVAMVYVSPQATRSLRWATSNNRGRTWSPPRTIVNAPQADIAFIARPAALVQRDGVLRVFFIGYVRDTGRADSSEANLWTTTSNDAGQTWSSPRRIWAGYTGMLTGAIETAAGALVVPFSYRADDQRFLSGCVISHDRGDNWKFVGGIDIGRHDTTRRGGEGHTLEPAAVELATGQVLLLLRTFEGSLWRCILDPMTQEVTPPTRTMLGCGGTLEVLRLASGRLLLAWNDARPDPDARNGFPKGYDALSVALSDDEGHSWSAPLIAAQGARTVHALARELAPGQLLITLPQHPLLLHVSEQALCQRLKLADSAEKTPTKPPLNVLLIAVDDLRPALGCYGDPIAKTPQIDRLARRGLVFERAYCQSALCNPSRASMLTGRRPETLQIFDLHQHFRERFPDLVTLPQHFKNHGYHTQALGKVFHPALTCEKARYRMHDAPSWSAPWWTPPYLRYHTPEGNASCRKFFKVPPTLSDEQMRRKHPTCRGNVWEASDAPEDEYTDAQLAAQAIKTLGEIRDRPFFFAVGFYKPHVPFIAPQKYFDLYPLESLPLAEARDFPRDVPPWVYTDLPRGTTSAELRSHFLVDRTGSRLTFDERHERELRRAYYACVSFIDAQVGRLLDELDRLELADRTVVVLWGDHGYHLGDQALWGKMTNYESAARAPLVVVRPDLTPAAERTNALVEFVDLYPSLAEICGLPEPAGVEGTSFAPLWKNPDQPWKRAAFTSLLRTQVDGRPGPTIYGRSLRTPRYRITEWEGLHGPAVELFDHENDPHESRNLAARPEAAELVQQLRAELAAGWRAAAPPESRTRKSEPIDPQ